MKSKGYQPRIYRTVCQQGALVSFNVTVKESDLFIRAERELSKQTLEILNKLRNDIKSYIAINQSFLTSLSPIKVSDPAPSIVKAMADAATIVGVGPMAAVAGAIAEAVARDLSQYSEEVIVENGGDIYIINKQSLTVGIYAGNSPLSMKLGIEVSRHPQGISVCTSSGTVGHSLSFGAADAAVIIAQNGSLADAAATAVCNMVRGKEDIERALEFSRTVPGILGAVIVINDKIGLSGETIELVNLAND